MAIDLFSVPVFLIILRETLETAIIVSVLLAFLKQTLDGPNQDAKVYNSLRRQVKFPPLTPQLPDAHTRRFGSARALAFSSA